MRDALKNYLSMASGFGEIGRQRALAASRALVAQGEATAEQVSGLAEDLLRSTKENRALVTTLVRSEVDRALSRVGLATADEVRKLTGRLRDLEVSLRETSAGRAAASAKPNGKRPSARVATGTRRATARPAAPSDARGSATAKPAGAASATRRPAAAKQSATKPAGATTSARRPAATKASAKAAGARATGAAKAVAKASAARSATPVRSVGRKATRSTARKATP